MSKVCKITFVVFSVFFILYLVLPSPPFPEPPPDSLQSNEPADKETILRRGYFTNFSREEVLEHYLDQFGYLNIVATRLPTITYRLNYPPEEAQTLIRDQTRSTFLEEIVHPFRESIYVNGFKPKEDKDTIIVNGKRWRQKIIIRYVPSKIIYRIIAGVLILTSMYLLSKFITLIIKQHTHFREK